MIADFGDFRWDRVGAVWVGASPDGSRATVDARGWCYWHGDPTKPGALPVEKGDGGRERANEARAARLRAEGR